MALESIHSFYPAQILYRNLAEIDSVGVLLCLYWWMVGVRVDRWFYHFGWAAAETTAVPLLTYDAYSPVAQLYFSIVLFKL